MMRISPLAAAAAIISTTALATGSHSGGHSHGDAMVAIGHPGDAAKVDRSIEIVMLENGDGTMAFRPDSITAAEGETVRLVLHNRGKLTHEFVMDRHEEIMEHKAHMERLPDMEHDDPNAMRLGPGETGEIVWTFPNVGGFEFACLIPGHYNLGMRGTLAVVH
jgi:uncharacterized cupredoxin-like copper-binding protein